MDPRSFVLTALAMVAFAGNSIFCRLALRDTAIDPISFTSIRLVSGAAMLAALVRFRGSAASLHGSWTSALALFGYAIAFSTAYVGLSAGTGALILFGAVQVTMIGYGVARGERLRASQTIGFALAAAGLVGLMLPGLSAPPVGAAAAMAVAGVAWGVYSLRGKGTVDPLAMTSGNFIRSVPCAAALSVAWLTSARVDRTGILLAVASGAVTSGLGYAIWYSALPRLSRTAAASVQLSVPVIAAIVGVITLGEQPTQRLFLASIAVIGGIALVVRPVPGS